MYPRKERDYDEVDMSYLIIKHVQKQYTKKIIELNSIKQKHRNSMKFNTPLQLGLVELGGEFCSYRGGYEIHSFGFF